MDAHEIAAIWNGEYRTGGIRRPSLNLGVYTQIKKWLSKVKRN